MTGRRIVVYAPRQDDYLAHHGVKGQKWGIRRFQPYSTTGARKGGKTGKEIGEAAKKAGSAVGSTGVKAAKAVGSAGANAVNSVKTSISRKIEKKRKEREEKKRKQKEEVMRARKAKAESTKAAKALVNPEKFTTEELKSVRERLKIEQEVADIRVNNVKRLADYAKAINTIVGNTYAVSNTLSTILTGKDIKSNVLEARAKRDEAGTKDAKKPTAAEGAVDGKGKKTGGDEGEDGSSGKKAKTKTGTDTPDDSGDDSGSGGAGKKPGSPGESKPEGGSGDGSPGDSGKKSDDSSSRYDSKSAKGDTDSSGIESVAKGLAKANLKYKIDHAKDHPALVFGKSVTTRVESMVDAVDWDASKAKVSGDKKTKFSSMDPENNKYVSPEAARSTKEVETYKSSTKSSSASNISDIVSSLSKSSALKPSSADTVASIARKAPAVTKTVLAITSIVSPSKANSAMERVANPKDPLQRLASKLDGVSATPRTTSTNQYSVDSLDSQIGMAGARYASTPSNPNAYRDVIDDEEERRRKLSHSDSMYLVDRSEYLAHYGRKGQKWGVRRFQNEDGSLTPAGKRQQRQQQNRPVGREKNVTGTGSVHAVKPKPNRPVGREKNVTGTGSVHAIKPGASAGGGGYVEDPNAETEFPFEQQSQQAHKKPMSEANKPPFINKPQQVQSQTLSDLKKSDFMRKALKFAASVNSAIGNLFPSQVSKPNRPVGREKNVTGTGKVTANKSKSSKSNRPVGRDPNVTGAGIATINKSKPKRPVGREKNITGTGSVSIRKKK